MKNELIEQCQIFEEKFEDTIEKEAFEKLENECIEYMNFLLNLRNFLHNSKYRKNSVGKGVHQKILKKDYKDLYKNLLEDNLVPQVLKAIRKTEDILTNFTNNSLEEIYGNEYYNYHSE